MNPGIIDFDFFCANFDTPELRKEVYETLETVIPEYIQLFSDARQNEDHSLVEKTAHRFKSGAYSLGAMSLFEILNTLEQKSKERIPFSEILPDIQKISELSVTALAEVRTFIRNDG